MNTDIQITPKATLINSYALCKEILTSPHYSSDRLAILSPVNETIMDLLKDWSLFNDGDKARSIRSFLSQRIKKVNPLDLISKIQFDALESNSSIFEEVIESTAFEIMAEAFQIDYQLINDNRISLYNLIDYIFSTPPSEAKLENATKAALTLQTQLRKTEPGLTDPEINQLILLLVGGLFLPTSMAAVWYTTAEHHDKIGTQFYKAAEESLRLFSPSKLTTRVAIHATELNGHKVRVGDQLILAIHSANRDERIFIDAHTFRLDRKESTLSFGIGEHKCLGEKLTLQTCAIWLEQLKVHNKLNQKLNIKLMENSGLNFIQSIEA